MIDEEVQVLRPKISVNQLGTIVTITIEEPKRGVPYHQFIISYEKRTADDASSVFTIQTAWAGEIQRGLGHMQTDKPGIFGQAHLFPYFITFL